MLITITESKLKSIIKKSIQETLEVWKDNELDKLVQDIIAYFKYHKKEILKEMPYNENNPYHVNNFVYKGIEVKVFVFYSEKRKTYGEYVDNLSGDKHINMFFNITEIEDKKVVYNMISHELTHFMDYKRNYDTDSQSKGYLADVEYDRGYKDVIENIIYRLWNTTERNAYTATVVDYDYFKDYVKRLKDNIEFINDKANPDNVELERWQSIAKRLFPSYVKPNTPWEKYKNIFIKKSQFLLNKFYKKGLQRFGAWNNRTNNIVTDTDIDNRIKQYKFNDKLNKLIPNYFYKMYKYYKNNGDFDSWYKEYGLPKRLNKSFLKNEWDKMINTMSDDIK